MQRALAQFRTNVARARDLCGLAQALGAQTTPAMDVTDLLRAALVLAVSALDHFIHEVSRAGMLEIAAGKRSPTDAYYRFQVSMRGVAAAQQSDGLAWLDQEIRDRHGWLSFQDPNKLADALRNVTAKDIWRELAAKLGMAPDEAKSRLRLIVDRRNKIAHEADMDPTAPGFRWPISAGIVSDAIGFLESLSSATVEVVTVSEPAAQPDVAAAEHLGRSAPSVARR